MQCPGCHRSFQTGMEAVKAHVMAKKACTAVALREWSQKPEHSEIKENATWYDAHGWPEDEPWDDEVTKEVVPVKSYGKKHDMDDIMEVISQKLDAAFSKGYDMGHVDGYAKGFEMGKSEQFDRSRSRSRRGSSSSWRK